MLRFTPDILLTPPAANGLIAPPAHLNTSFYSRAHATKTLTSAFHRVEDVRKYRLLVEFVRLIDGEMRADDDICPFQRPAD